MISQVMPRRAAIRQLIDDGEVMVVLQIVRYLDDADGEEEQITRVGDLEKLGGQHQLLGWHLDRSVVGFLYEVDAELDVDETVSARRLSRWNRSPAPRLFADRFAD